MQDLQWYATTRTGTSLSNFSFVIYRNPLIHVIPDISRAMHWEIGGTKQLLGYVNALGTKCRVHWLITVSPFLLLFSQCTVHYAQILQNLWMPWWFARLVYWLKYEMIERTYMCTLFDNDLETAGHDQIIWNCKPITMMTWCKWKRFPHRWPFVTEIHNL